MFNKPKEIIPNGNYRFKVVSAEKKRRTLSPESIAQLQGSKDPRNAYYGWLKLEVMGNINSPLPYQPSGKFVWYGYYPWHSDITQKMAKAVGLPTDLDTLHTIVGLEWTGRIFTETKDRTYYNGVSLYRTVR